MKKNLVPVLVAAFGLAASPALLAQGCCGGGAAKGGCSMGAGTSAASGCEAHAGAQAATAQPTATAKAVLPQPVQAVFNAYIQMQTALAADSLPGFQDGVTVLTQAVRKDSEDLLPAKVSQQVQALGKAQDLAAAREAFKPLSESLIQYLKDKKVPPGTYHEAYCGMAKASWLQTDTTLNNPYMGKAMLRCGELRR